MKRPASKRYLVRGLAVLGALALLAGPVRAQQICACATTSPFGSCSHRSTAYRDSFPGAAAVVPRAGQPAYLYVADLYGGFTYRYLTDTFQTATPDLLTSPLGSNATTGIAHRQDGSETRLYWAIENKLYRTDLNIEGRTELGEVELARLAQLIRDLPADVILEMGQTVESVRGLRAGTLGGITYHEGRSKFWGIDIVNDVYFEFGDDGKLTVEGGRPVFFFSPRRNRLTGGAYGTSIAYVKTASGEFFDVPVGALPDLRPTEVHRVYARDGSGLETFRIGEGAGSSYLLGPALGSPKYVTGIAFWPDSCGGGQSSEILLDLDVVGGSPKIIEVSADAPIATSISDFQCVSSEATVVTLRWNKTSPYTSLRIQRKRLGSTEPAILVFETTDFANDPQTFVDRGLLDGAYEYSAEVTAGAVLAPVTCTLTLGLGSLVSHRRLQGTGGEVTPYAITVAKSETVIVADRATGNAETFTLDLEPRDTLNGPFDADVIGLAYDSKDGSLYWLQNSAGRHLLQKTSLTGEPQGSSIRVQFPAGLQGTPQLGELSYDEASDSFWTADLKTERIFGVTPAGAVAAPFKASQIASPQPNGVLSGGIAVSAAADKVLLDLPVGRQRGGIVTEIGRFEYTRANLAAPPREVFRIDLVITTGSADIGGIDIVQVADERFLYAVGVDTRAVYKLRLTGTPGADPFRRGDVNSDGSLNISDPSYLLSFLFKGGAEPPCQRAGDVNDSSTIDITDPIDLFNYLFRGGAPPPPPFLQCGVDLDSRNIPCVTPGCVGS